MKDKQSKQRRHSWSQWSLLTLMFMSVAVVSGLMPFIRRAEVVRFWKKVRYSDHTQIDIASGGPTPTAQLLGVPRLLKLAFPDIADEYFDSVRSIYFEKPLPELQAQVAQHLGSCRNLVHLHWHGEVSSSIAQKMSRCEHLSMLKLNGCHKTDLALSYVGKLSDLQILTLNDCSLTVSGIEKLSRLKQLRMLLMYETAISQASIETLRDQLPNCYVLSFDKQDLESDD